MFDKTFLPSRGLPVVSTAALGIVLAVLGGRAFSAQDKYTVEVPGGLAFSEFKGYEAWQAISISPNERVLATTLGKPAMIGLPGRVFPATARPSPTGPRRLRSIWTPRKNSSFRMQRCRARNVDFMVRDSKRFTDSGGRGYGVFEYDATSDTFKPGTSASAPRSGMTPSAGSRATRQRRREVTF